MEGFTVASAPKKIEFRFGSAASTASPPSTPQAPLSPSSTLAPGPIGRGVSPAVRRTSVTFGPFDDCSSPKNQPAVWLPGVPPPVASLPSCSASSGARLFQVRTVPETTAGTSTPQQVLPQFLQAAEVVGRPGDVRKFTPAHVRPPEFREEGGARRRSEGSIDIPVAIDAWVSDEMHCIPSEGFTRVRVASRMSRGRSSASVGVESPSSPSSLVAAQKSPTAARDSTFESRNVSAADASSDTSELRSHHGDEFPKGFTLKRSVSNMEYSRGFTSGPVSGGTAARPPPLQARSDTPCGSRCIRLDEDSPKAIRQPRYSCDATATVHTPLALERGPIRGSSCPRPLEHPNREPLSSVDFFLALAGSGTQRSVAEAVIPTNCEEPREPKGIDTVTVVDTLNDNVSLEVPTTPPSLPVFSAKGRKQSGSILAPRFHPESAQWTGCRDGTPNRVPPPGDESAGLSTSATNSPTTPPRHAERRISLHWSPEGGPSATQLEHEVGGASPSRRARDSGSPTLQDLANCVSPTRSLRAALATMQASHDFGRGSSPTRSSNHQILHSSAEFRSSSPPKNFRTSLATQLTPHNIRHLYYGTLSPDESQDLVEEMLFDSLPRQNVAEVEVKKLRNDRSSQMFLRALRDDGGRWPRVRVTWHLAGGSEAATAIMENGICCDEDHCVCGRYGHGGYVASTAAKANAYSDSCDRRYLFLVLAIPGEVVEGERGSRPATTAADLPSHPTEYCFVDSSRLHCVSLVTYRWIPTGRREKLTSPRVSHIVPRRNVRVPPTSRDDDEKPKPEGRQKNRCTV